MLLRSKQPALNAEACPFHYKRKNAPVAQRIEQIGSNDKVEGSIPSGRTNCHCNMSIYELDRRTALKMFVASLMASAALEGCASPNEIRKKENGVEVIYTPGKDVFGNPIPDDGSVKCIIDPGTLMNKPKITASAGSGDFIAGTMISKVNTPQGNAVHFRADIGYANEPKTRNTAMAEIPDQDWSKKHNFEFKWSKWFIHDFYWDDIQFGKD